MAGVSTKDIKQRIRSMESTRQITRAMEMVAASKLRHAQDRIRDNRPLLRDPLWNHCPHRLHPAGFFLPYLTRREGKRVCCIVIAGDRGLAGGYNNNMFKLVQQELGRRSYRFCPWVSGQWSISAAGAYPCYPGLQRGGRCHHW